MARHRRGNSGFTLIELMIVVAIIGILSSVAYPGMRQATLRSKATERTYMMQAIKAAIEDVYRLNDRFPVDAETFTSAYNPGSTPTANKRIFDTSDTGWQALTRYLQIEGATYYSYRYSAWELGTPGCWVEAYGDLDGDGLFYSETAAFLRDRGAYMPNGAPTETNPNTY